ncbi:MAG: phenylacetate-CoA oxygenase subunit PaaJ [Alphaproteobacteria bacterium]|jgi:ring-1,2-phenylacetyl-CoA epoxidase subunit PaaD|nr:phenylacetate-CoA oxygenase subunit PaaJ [Alphaproteobacteria bacterium]
MVSSQTTEQRALAVAAAVPDPEIPALTIADLGILRAVEIAEDGGVIAHLSPTYMGCPAVLAIELAVTTALQEAGFQARTERILSPPWTTDWITEEGRRKMAAYGIAPPVPEGRVPDCPQCGSASTEKLSEFGSTACKALWRCTACLEPFDYFKCL